MGFLNSKIWREFQCRVGREIFELSDKVYVVKMDLPFDKNYLYSASPHATEYLNEIKKIGHAQSAMFFKCEPLIEWTENNRQQITFERSGFRKAIKAIQPQRTIILNLNFSQDDLLKQMHQKTRYNIHLSEKKFLVLEKSYNLNVFWDLLQKTSERTEFSTYPKEYYKKLLELKNVDLYFVKRYDDFVAGAIVISYNNRMTYLHGASNYNLRKYMGPYFLHWELIKMAKSKDMEEYDFWGIDEKKWPGVTRFKRGFGGREINYVGSWDLIFKPIWYWLYKMKNKI